MSANLTIPAEFAEIAAICVASEGMIGNRSALTVNARDLHAGLGVGRVFGAWIEGRIAKYGFQEGVDYQILLSRSGKQTGSGGHNAKEYDITLDMAKELSMVENNDKGRLARRYFIWREQQALSIQPSVSVAQMAQRIMQSLGGMMKGILNKQVTPKIEQLSQKVDGVLAVRPVGVAVVTHRTAKRWLDHYGITKRPRGLVRRVSNALMRQSIRMGYTVSYTAEEEVRSFHEVVANAYFSTGPGRHLLPKSVKGQKEMGLEANPVPFSQTPA